MADDEDATQEAPADGALATSDLGQVTVSAGQLAYSDHTTSMPVVDYRPPRLRPVWIGALVLAAATAMGAAMFVLGRTTAQDPEVQSAPVVVTTTPPAAVVAVPAPTTAAPTVAVVPPAPPPPAPEPTLRRTGADAAFLSRMHSDGIPYRSGDDDAIVTAHLVCNSLSDGTYDSMMGKAAAVESSQGWTFQQSMDFVTAAVTYYCPENAR